MKKSLFILVLAVAFIACNNKPPQDCDDYPYCIDDFSIHPDNWLCGKLKPEPSPFNEKDTVVAMTIKYVYHSDMNGLTYFITKNKELFSLLDESGNRKESILMCDYKVYNSFYTSFVLYPYKSLSDLPPEVLKTDISNFSIGYSGVLVFDYEMEIQGGQTYDKTTKTGHIIHLFDISDDTYFDNVFYPI